MIVQNSEKFITFSFGYFQFKDSSSFLSASLDKLVSLNKYEGNDKIKDWENNFKYTQTNPHIKTKADLNWFTQKGVYPYDYMGTFKRLEKTKLPDKQHFYSQLYETGVTHKDHAKANMIWKHFNCNTLGDYHDLYSMSAVYFLTDVFENFRGMCVNCYGLGPAK